VSSDVSRVNGLGDQVPYNCPGCGGVLWKIDGSGESRYRCHTGHSYTGLTLLASQSEKIEEMLWISLRMFEERKNLLMSLTESAATVPLRREHRQRAAETQGYIDRIRAMLLDPRSDQPEDRLTRVKALMAEPRQAKSTR
jgi:two-component system chemotaxis response regulator CheB